MLLIGNLRIGRLAKLPFTTMAHSDGVGSCGIITHWGTTRTLAPYAIYWYTVV